MSEVTGRLEAWFTEQITKKEFIIWGFVYDDIHKRFDDGEWIHTSGIRNVKPEEGMVVNTRNSSYLLGVSATDVLTGEENE